MPVPPVKGTILLPRIACVLALTASLASISPAEEPTVLVECADGSIVAGTFATGASVTISGKDGEKRIAAREIRRLSLSTMSDSEAGEIQAAVEKLRSGLGAEEYADREEATAQLQMMPGVIAPFVARFLSDADPEIAARARLVLDRISASRDLQDARDYVLAEGKVFRGRLALETIGVQTVLGAAEFPRASVRSICFPGFERWSAPTPDEFDEWPPPMAEIHPPTVEKDALAVVLYLKGGWRLVGGTAKEMWNFNDEKDVKVEPADLLKIERNPDAPAEFLVRRKGGPDINAGIGPWKVEVAAAGRTWTVPAELFESVEFGPLHGRNTLAPLVEKFLNAKTHGTPPPSQRFWVGIRDQSANPWDTRSEKAMTWTLRNVVDKACLVGQDEITNAYQGDTSLDEALPILCIRQGTWPVPAGLNVSGSYNGWSGGEVRLTGPVKGRDLKSPQAAQAIVTRDLGEGWEMAEHHQPGSGGWRFWAYWEAPGEEKK